MQNLIPHFIHAQFQAQTYSGRFSAASLFVDLSGFSAVTEAFMRHGQEGAEALAGMMESLFEPLVEGVYAQGGFITGFAGDAFTAVFPGDPAQTAPRALAAATAIQQHLAEHPTQVTPYGAFAFAVKLGLAAGDVEWGILRPPEPAIPAAYYFSGPAIDACAAAEHHARPGELLLSSTVHATLDALVKAKPLEDGWQVREVVAALPAPQPVTLPALPPADLAAFLPPALYQAGPRGEFRQVLTLFLNLKDIRTTQQLAFFIQSVFRLQKQYGGYLTRIDFGDKGCNLLLLWGTPTSFENDVERALNFVLALPTVTPGVFRAGMTYRLMYAGIVGARWRQEYSCYGQGVNLAARLMTAAPWGDVWLDAGVAHRAGQHFALDREGELAFKGLAEKQAVYVLGERREDVAPFYQGALVGRQAELARLATFVQPLRAGHHAGVLVVHGEAGLGKSRLVHAFQAGLEAGADAPQWALCQSDQILRQSLNPFRYFLRHYFEQSEAQSEARNKRRFSQKLDALIDATPEPALQHELTRTGSCLGALVDLYWPDSLYAQLDPEGRFQNTVLALQTLLQAESLRRPLVVHLEDAHWLDADSAQFVQQLAGQSHAYPMAVIATARPEPTGPLFGPELSYAQIDLAALPESDLGQLAAAILDAPAAPALVALLAERAEGNPFFAEQLLLYLREQGQLVIGDNGLAPATAGVLLPGDVRALLIARLDQLAQPVREVVQTASVLGREFEVQVLVQMRSQDAAVLEKVSAAAQAAIWSAVGVLRYLFKHALLRDAAYDMQLRAQRRQLHQRAAEALHVLYADDLAPHYGALAYHFEQAGSAAPACFYLEKAGDQARDAYHNALAADYYGRALALAPHGDLDPAACAGLLARRGRVLELDSRFEEALATYEQMEQLARENGERSIELAALMSQGQLRCTANRLFDALQGEALAEHALTLARALSERAAESKILWNLLNLYRLTGRFAQAREYGERSLSLARELGLREQLAYTLNDLAHIHRVSGNLVPARQLAQEASGLWRELGNLPMLADSLSTTALVQAFAGDYAVALALSDEAYQISQSIENVWGRAYSRFWVWQVYWDQGDPGRAIAVMEDCIRLGGQAGFTLAGVVVGAELALLYGRLGALEQGFAAVRHALPAESRVPQVMRSYARMALAQLYLLRGDLAEAATTLAASGADSETPVLPATLHVAETHALLALVQGDHERVLALTARMLDDLSRHGMSALLPGVLDLRSQALLALGRKDEAWASLIEARAAAEALGVRRSLWPVLSRLSQLAAERGQADEAGRLRRAAREIVLHIADHAGAPELRAAFLGLPQVQAVLDAA